MTRRRSFGGAAAAFLLLTALGAAPAADEKVGIFQAHRDIGDVRHPGSAVFDESTRSYTISGSGKNMWFAVDAFQLAWKEAGGDLTLSADVAFVGPGKDPHRKACLMIRQGLEPDAAYADVALHGDGLTSLQFRDTKGDNTHEVQANVRAPRRLKIERRGQYVRVFLAPEGGEFAFSGAAVRIALDGPLYVGLGVCSHDDSVVEKAIFSNVELVTDPPKPSGKPTLYSTLETQALASTDRRVVHVSTTRFEAPNWLADGKALIYNSGGRIYRVPAEGGEPKAIDTGFATRCNNDHGLSPDGKLLAISDKPQRDRKSRIYTLLRRAAARRS